VIEAQGDRLLIKGFPMSLTSNHQYIVSRGRLIKSSEYRKYSIRVHNWALKHKGAFDKLREILRGKTLRVDCAFVFPREKLITKKNTLKKLDYSNRIKSCFDELSKLIGVDDSHFISGYCCKKISDNDEAYINITISIDKFIE
jgi:hypothetical protein